MYRGRCGCPDRGRRGWGLEEDVGEGVAFGDLLLDLGLQVVGGVFGFPEAVDKGEVINEGAIGTEGLLARALELVLLDEVPAEGAAALLDEVSEGGAGVALGGVAVLFEGGEGGVTRWSGKDRGLCSADLDFDREDGLRPRKAGPSTSVGMTGLWILPLWSK